MKIFMATDNHLGYRPKQHVTSKSAQMYEERVLEQAHKAIEQAGESDRRLNLGDLFHRYSNPEKIILEGHAVAEQYTYTLSGNHDVKNIQGVKGSLDVVAGMLPEGRVIFTHGINATPETESGEDTCQFYFMCHYFTQEEFEAALRSKMESTTKHSKKSYLFLHCNVGNGFGQAIEAEQSSLYFTDELQDEALEHFDAIFVGHEHIKRTVKERIHILGNTFPLTFGEMADRFVHIYDTDTDELEAIKIFSVEDELLELHAEEVIDGNVTIDPAVSFIDIYGEITSDQRPALSKALLALWKQAPEQILSIRNQVTVVESKKASTLKKQSLDFFGYVRNEAESAGYAAEMSELENE